MNTALEEEIDRVVERAWKRWKPEPVRVCPVLILFVYHCAPMRPGNELGSFKERKNLEDQDML